MLPDDQTPDATALTVQLLSAYLANNAVASEELAELIRSTRAALTANAPAPAMDGEPESFTPSFSARRSLSSPEHIISLIDGKPYKTLKRHLASHGLTPESYRQRYNLAATYPMVAPAYAAHRRSIAQKIGLGSRKPAADRVEPQDRSQVAQVPAAQFAKRRSGKPPVSAETLSELRSAAVSGKGRSKSAISSDNAEWDDAPNGIAAVLTGESLHAEVGKKRSSRKAKQGSNEASAPAKASQSKVASGTKAKAEVTSAKTGEARAGAETNGKVANVATKRERRGRLSLFRSVDAQEPSPVESANERQTER